jgi:hypothetical protein
VESTATEVKGEGVKGRPKEGVKVSDSDDHFARVMMVDNVVVVVVDLLMERDNDNMIQRFDHGRGDCCLQVINKI